MLNFTHFDPISLRLFVTVCEVGSITEAADRESITPSAVSKRLTALEEQIGTPLLERGRRGVEPTAAGEALLPAARQLLQSMVRIHAGLSSYAKNVRGHVRVVASMSAIAEFLPSDIAEFIRRHETVRVSLSERLSPDVVRFVEEGRADVGVCWDAVEMGTLEHVPYRSDHLVLLVPSGHELARRRAMKFCDTLQYDHVNIQQGSTIQRLLERSAAEAGASVRYRVEVTTVDAACRIVAANLAVAVVPREVAQPIMRTLDLRAVSLSDSWAQRQFVVCMRGRADLTVSARQFVDTLLDRSIAC